MTSSGTLNDSPGSYYFFEYYKHPAYEEGCVDFFSPRGRKTGSGQPDEDVDGLAVVGAEDHVGGAQEGLQNVQQPGRHFVHLVEDEDGAGALGHVALHPRLQLLLHNRSPQGD